MLFIAVVDAARRRRSSPQFVGADRQPGVDAFEIDDALLVDILHARASPSSNRASFLGEAVELGIGHHQLAVGKGSSVGAARRPETGTGDERVDRERQQRSGQRPAAPQTSGRAPCANASARGRKRRPRALPGISAGANTASASVGSLGRANMTAIFYKPIARRRIPPIGGDVRSPSGNATCAGENRKTCDGGQLYKRQVRSTQLSTRHTRYGRPALIFQINAGSCTGKTTASPWRPARSGNR